MLSQIVSKRFFKKVSKNQIYERSIFNLKLPDIHLEVTISPRRTFDVEENAVDRKNPL